MSADHNSREAKKKMELTHGVSSNITNTKERGARKRNRESPGRNLNSKFEKGRQQRIQKEGKRT